MQPVFCGYLESRAYLSKTFPQKLMLAVITPVQKKEDSTKVKNYRSVSVFPTVSKIFERLMQFKYVNTLTCFCLLFFVITEKDLAIKLLLFG